MTDYTVAGEAIETTEPEAPATEFTATRQTGHVRLADGRQLTVELGNPDQIRWEQTAARRWPELLPDADENGRMRFKAPLFMQTFVVWAALKRCRLYDGEFQEFSEHDALDVDVTEEPVHPTLPAHSAG